MTAQPLRFRQVTWPCSVSRPLTKDNRRECGEWCDTFEEGLRGWQFKTFICNDICRIEGSDGRFYARRYTDGSIYALDYES